MLDSTETEAVHEEIARRAYGKFCERGCVHGGDVDDWIAAEREILTEGAKPVEPPNNTAEDRPRRRNGKSSQ